MDPKQLLEAHQYLDGEMSHSDRQRFENLMESDDKLSRYVDQLKDMERSMDNLETLPAPAVKFPSPVFTGLTGLWEVTWRIRAVPAAAVILLFAALLGRSMFPAAVSVPEIQPANIKLVYFSTEAASVSVVGSFNRWQEEIQLHPREDSGYWVTSIDVPPGEYSYSFLIDGKVRLEDPTANSFMEDDYGSRNSVVRVGI